MISKVSNEQQIERVEQLANEIWREHYTPIIGKAQVDYMLSMFQSKQAIKSQINKEGYLYYLIEDKNEAVGYICVRPSGKELILSKIYIKASQQGNGYGKKAINFIEDIAKEKDLNKITLTVNKYNTKAISVYEKLGFINQGSIVQNIGEGFIMDDYKMEKIMCYRSQDKIESTA